MDCIVVSDDESDAVDDLELVNAAHQLNDNDRSSAILNDELLAIELELSEIDEQIYRLRSKRTHLVERQQKLQTNIEENRASSHKSDSIEKWQRTDFPWSSNVTKVLQDIFRIKLFRPWQLETINVALSDHDCILIMPTGGGKSLCYQLPALISSGITIVVSPLLSLVEDQVYALKKLDVDARALNSSTPRDEQTQIMRILDGKNQEESTMKILYLTPEKIAKSKMIMSKLQKLYESNRFARLVVDEVHCVSQFGHDFRPDYKYLSIFKRQFPKVSILGLTATATMKVIEDIQKILNIPRCILFRAPFNRKNLFYEVIHKSDVGKDAFGDLVHCIQHRFDKQSGIVYCLSQKDAEDVCCELQKNGIKAGCYHAGLSGVSRTQVHERWLRNQVHVICATIAFGMGIDKPDVRFVIHHSLSKSIENFYQESGRAGRDDQQSHCILFFRFGDVFRLAPMVFSDKSGNGLTNLYSMISYCLNESACRRKLVAKYFDEVWQSSDCNRMCDICTRPSNYISKRNCREEAAIIIEYLQANRKQRLTPLKLIEQINIKTMIKIDLQRLILQMIMDQYLKEDFHFTPYNTICYVVPGPKSKHVRSDHCQILMDLIESTKKRTSTNGKTAEKAIVKKKSPSTKPPEARPKLQRVTNTDRSSQLKKRSLQYDDTDDDEEQVENAPLSKRHSSVKTNEHEAEETIRSSVIDDEELDFLFPMPIAMNFNSLTNHYQDRCEQFTECSSKLEVKLTKSPLSNGTNRPSRPPPPPTAVKPRLRPSITSTPVRISRKINLEELSRCSSSRQFTLPDVENEKWLAMASSTEHILVGGGSSSTLRLFDFQGKELNVLDIKTFAAFDMAWSSALNAFLIAGYERLQMYHVATNELTQVEDLEPMNKKDTYFWSIACHGNDLFVVLSDGLESIWRVSLPSFKRTQTLSGSEIRQSNADDRISCIRTNGHSIAMAFRQRNTQQWRVDLFEYASMTRTHRGLTIGCGTGAFNFIERCMLAPVDDHQWLIIGGCKVKSNVLTLMNDQTGEIKQVERPLNLKDEFFGNICTSDSSNQQKQIISMILMDANSGERQIHVVQQQQQ